MTGVVDPVGQYGERLFELYLSAHNLSAQYEPELDGVRKRIDFVIGGSGESSINAEVKTIYEPPPVKSGVRDPYRAIRAQIEAGRMKFSEVENSINVLVLAAFPGSFVNLTKAYLVLGSMVGDYGFIVPFDPQRSAFNSSLLQRTFLPGRGRMDRGTSHRNTRISALITLHSSDEWSPQIPSTLGEWKRMAVERLAEPNMLPPYVTVYENPVARNRLPENVFDGPSDARCSHDGTKFWWSFKGERRSPLD